MDLMETVRRYELDSSGSGQGPVVGCCEHGNEHSGSIKSGEFLDWLSLLPSSQGLFSLGLVSSKSFLYFNDVLSVLAEAHLSWWYPSLF
jgi:hypothetical protein